MALKILEVINRYCKFENILPEELLEIDFTELETAKNEIKIIMKDDLVSIRILSAQKNLNINIDEFKKQDYII